MCAVDIVQARTDFVRAHGLADATVCLPRGERPPSPEDGLRRAQRAAQDVLAQLGAPAGFDVVYEQMRKEQRLLETVVSRLGSADTTMALYRFVYAL